MTKAPKTGGAKRVEGASMLTPEVVRALISQLGATRHSDAVDEAQEIMFDAWECDDPKRRLAMARKALKVSPLCADAYLLLAEETARTEEEALDLYAKAVDAGEKALGKAAFEEDAGMFWGLIETRPYMRARHLLIIAQWRAGRRDDAAASAEDMLRLNPNDNQGIRYLLIDWLLRLGRDGDAEKLFKRYKHDCGAEWLWPATLAAFRAKGGAAATRTALKQALASNPHVPDYLLGRKKLPRQTPDYISPGGKDEAVAYVGYGQATWAETPGALVWLDGQVGPPAPRRRAINRP